MAWSLLALLDDIDLCALEKDKIKRAVRTDFILSAEIIAITLGTVASSEFAVQLGVLSAIAVVMTVGVYALVAGIVQIDDFGLHLSRRPGAAARWAGNATLQAAPWLMKGLSVAGTAAMFLVGGGILAHGIARLDHALDALAEAAAPAASALPAMGIKGLSGVVAGAAVLGVVTLAQRLAGRKAAA
jgi:uncharacterized protein